MLQQIDDFHKTPAGYITFAGVELVLAYILAIRAIDTGKLWLYGLTILLAVGVISNIVRLFARHTELVHKPHARRKRSHKKA